MISKISSQNNNQLYRQAYCFAMVKKVWQQKMLEFFPKLKSDLIKIDLAIKILPQTLQIIILSKDSNLLAFLKTEKLTLEKQLHFGLSTDSKLDFKFIKLQFKLT